MSAICNKCEGELDADLRCVDCDIIAPMQKRMAKLEAVYEAAKFAIKDADPMFRTTAELEFAVKALDSIGSGE